MTTLNNRGPSGFFSTWPAVSPRPETETRTEEIRKNIIAVSRRAASSRALPSEQSATLTAIAVALMGMMDCPWNGEGPLRAGFRSRLCLQGWRWEEADNAADAVVKTALRELGCSARPTWEMGQRGFAHPGESFIERTRCVHCTAQIPDDRTGGSKGRAAVIYCSDRCAVSASQARARLHLERASRAEYLARCASRSEATLSGEVDCEHCRKPFRPGYNLMRRRFCSAACAAAAKVKAGVRDRRGLRLPHECVCLGCADTFPAKQRDAKYCSNACYQDARARAANEWRGIERQCEVCSTIFRVHSVAKVQRTCSRHCAWTLRRRGVSAPKPAPTRANGEACAATETPEPTRGERHAA
jgi:hypothetical protein